MEFKVGLVSAVSSGERGSSIAGFGVGGLWSARSVTGVCCADGSAASVDAKVVIDKDVDDDGAAGASSLVCE